MRHLRFPSLEVALLPGGVIRATSLGVLVASSSPAEAVPPRGLGASGTAVDVASVTLAADAGETSTMATRELAVAVLHWPRRAQRVTSRLRAPSACWRGSPRVWSCNSRPSPRSGLGELYSLRVAAKGAGPHAARDDGMGWDRSGARVSPGWGGSPCASTASTTSTPRTV